MWYQDITEAVGRTPLVRLNAVAEDVKPTVLAKVEYFNPGNSVKDRIAMAMIEAAERAGKLRPGGTIVEGTSGNTGMGLALAAAVKGYRCIFTVTDKQSKEKLDILRAVGAEVIVCPTNVEPEDPRSYYSVAKRLSNDIPNSFYPNQYDNLNNRDAHYHSTGPELWQQTDGRITHFVAGMGTCGTIVGTSRYLKEQNPAIQTIGVDTYGSLFQKLHETGQVDPEEVYPYLTEGIGEDFVPQNLDLEVVDRIVKVSDKDAAIATRRLARLEGLFVGWSCGSAAHGALEIAKELGPKDVLVVLLPDHGSRYLGKVYNDEWMRSQGWLEEPSLMTARQILEHVGRTEAITCANPDTPLAEAVRLMDQHGVSQLPVMEHEQVIGSLSETRILSALVDDPALRTQPVRDIMADPFPFVLPSTRLDVISKMITRTNPAVLVHDPERGLGILTKHDLLHVLTA